MLCLWHRAAEQALHALGTALIVIMCRVKRWLETNLRDGFLWSSGLVVAAVLRHPLDVVATHSGV